MKKLVIDEWLWADLRGENQAERQRESFDFLQTVFERCDQLVTVAESVFLRKFWDLARNARTETLRKIVKAFKAQFFLNAGKLLLYEENELQPLSPEVRGDVKQDDQYLVRVYLASGADVLVTTDNPLIETLGTHNIQCRARNEFVRAYLLRQQQG